jgi:DivIVA domain-containing protein
VAREQASPGREEEGGWSAIASELGTGTARRSVVPPEIRDVSFRAAVRGYDRDDVDAYVKRVNRVVAELEVSSSPRAAVRHALDRVGDQVHGILQRARETAEEITRAALEEADEITARAKAEAADIVVNASTEADASRGEAASIVAAARNEAAEHLRRAEAEAEAAHQAADAQLRELEDEMQAIIDRRRELLTGVAQLATDLQGLAREAVVEESPPELDETEAAADLAQSPAAASSDSPDGTK